MLILRQKKFDTAVNVDGQVMNGAFSGPRDQAYYDNMFKNQSPDVRWDTQATQQQVSNITSQAKQSVGSFERTRNLGGQEVSTVGKVATGTEAAKVTGYNKGVNSTGITGGVRNTWNKAGTLGKAGMVAGSLAVTGLAVKGISSMFGNNNK